ncbi:hypothetical protein RB595_000761 [Gaeumannomyces hyphopodioides]
MPPPLPLGSQRLAFRPASNLLASVPLRATTTCSATHASRASPRQFSTTPAQCRIRIPPESPKFITIPEVVQPNREPKARVRGRLPVPRRVFDLRRLAAPGVRPPRAAAGNRRKEPAVDPRLEPGYVDRAMPRSQAEQAGRPPRSPLAKFRRTMADSRRAALADGIGGLYQRQRQRDSLARASLNARLRTRLEAARAPEPDDERLTRPTVRREVMSTAVQLDPHRFGRAAKSAKRTAAVAAAKSEARRDALQELYIAAKNFIVSEEELERHVETMFRPTYFSDAHKSIQTTKNRWDLDGSPITVKELMSQFARASKDSTPGTSESREAARQKAVAEQLTGGKLSTS